MVSNLGKKPYKLGEEKVLKPEASKRVAYFRDRVKTHVTRARDQVKLHRERAELER